MVNKYIYNNQINPFGDFVFKIDIIFNINKKEIKMVLDSKIDNIYPTSESEVIFLPFEEELFLKATSFKYSEFMLNTLYDTCKDQAFLNKLFQWACSKLNLNIEELKYYFETNFDAESSTGLNSLVDKQYHRIQVVTIEFLFEYLPFNYLIKVSKNRGNLLDNLLINIRQDLLEQITLEIQKIENMARTLDIVREGLQNKEQLKKFSNLHNASISVSKKTQLENMYMYSIIDNCPFESLKSILSQMMDDDLVYSNLYIK